MPTLKEILSEKIKTSMKSGDKETLTYARNLHAAVRKREIDDRVDLDDAGVQKIAGSLIKQRQESIDSFKKGGREDLVIKEEAELKFLQSFVPAQMSDEELQKIVLDSVEEAKATTIKELGAVMKILLPKVQGRADGKRIQQLVRERLGG